MTLQATLLFDPSQGFAITHIHDDHGNPLDPNDIQMVLHSISHCNSIIGGSLSQANTLGQSAVYVAHPPNCGCISCQASMGPTPNSNTGMTRGNTGTAKPTLPIMPRRP